MASIEPAESRLVRKRLATLRTGAITYRELRERRRRQAKRDQAAALLSAFGTKVSAKGSSDLPQRRWLVHAGFRHPQSVAIYIACRVILAAGLAASTLLVTAVLAMPAAQVWALTALMALAGWMLPYFYVDARVKKRQLELRRALPDMLDLLVVCVEAGLGLNQALVRVADEVDRISPEMSDELTVVNLEIRAGTPREEAMRNLGERTGVQDIRSLVSMLMQTDRFGTSIADSLRIHAETLRSKRMQGAEEKAAKTTVKMLFPLIFFIFPAVFVVLVGPAFFLFREFFGSM